MTSPYPITDQRSLLQAGKHGPFGLSGRRREFDELPLVKAHEVLVYRVGGDYVIDNGRRGLDDDQVVEATHVSVVDMTRNTPVRVELAIPSAEASEFTVQVTFACTVTDPSTVVREGQHDAGISLLNYLRSHHRIFELGLDHKMSAINTVRRDVKAQVQAYTQLKPPMIPGMSIAMASVEVLTPDELVDFYKELRGQERDHTIASGRQRYSHDLDRAKQQSEQVLERMRKQHAQELEEQRQMFEQLLAEQRRTFTRAELAEVSESVGDDPLRAARFGHARGELTTAELMAQLQAGKDREHADAEVWREREREDRLRKLEWQRDDDRQREAWNREDRLHALNVRLDLLKEVAKHGHLDEINLDVERLIQSLESGTEKALPTEIGAPSADRHPPALERADEDSGDDNLLREEDDD